MQKQTYKHIHIITCTLYCLDCKLMQGCRQRVPVMRRSAGVTDLCQSLQEEGKGSGDLHVLQQDQPRQ